MNIKANELRIGNLIQKNGKIHYTNNLTIRDIFYLSVDDTDIFEPIPLTEEWLLKCGLKYNGHMYSNGSILVISKDMSWIGIYMLRHEDDVKIDCPKYVHQLQNLYFALTGEELQIIQ